MFVNFVNDVALCLFIPNVFCCFASTCLLNVSLVLSVWPDNLLLFDTCLLFVLPGVFDWQIISSVILWLLWLPSGILLYFLICWHFVVSYFTSRCRGHSRVLLHCGPCTVVVTQFLPPSPISLLSTSCLVFARSLRFIFYLLPDNIVIMLVMFYCSCFYCVVRFAFMSRGVVIVNDLQRLHTLCLSSLSLLTIAWCVLMVVNGSCYVYMTYSCSAQECTLNFVLNAMFLLCGQFGILIFMLCAMFPFCAQCDTLIFVLHAMFPFCAQFCTLIFLCCMPCSHSVLNFVHWYLCCIPFSRSVLNCVHWSSRAACCVPTLCSISCTDLPVLHAMFPFCAQFDALIFLCCMPCSRSLLNCVHWSSRAAFNVPTLCSIWCSDLPVLHAMFPFCCNVVSSNLLYRHCARDSEGEAKSGGWEEAGEADVFSYVCRLTLVTWIVWSSS